MIRIFANEPRQQRITIETISVFILVDVGGVFDGWVLRVGRSVRDRLVMGNKRRNNEMEALSTAFKMT
ncbi:MAG: hypothetical protein P8H03_09975 [Emcibacteraceae bacterium]|nr:hypothetical protein [Emcibacteraceae bacterium]MDG1858565.1 hypothetical protein [Emcibacteraceae bacterium]